MRAVKREVPKFIFVPRQGIWMHNDVPAGELPPLITDLTLGQEFIDFSTIMGIDWTKHIDSCPEDYKYIVIGPHKSLYDVWEDAQDQITNYFHEYGYLDDEMNNLAPRLPRMGDEVQTFRRSSPGIMVRKGEFIPHWDNSHDVYEEPVEARDDEGTFLQGRMTKLQEDAIYEWDILYYKVKVANGGSKIITRKMQGVWMYEIHAASLGISPRYLARAPKLTEKKRVRRGNGDLVVKYHTYVFVQKSEVQY